MADILFHLSHRATFFLYGEDAERYLNNQITQDLRSLNPNQTVYTLVTNAKGKLEADAYVRAWATSGKTGYLLDVEPELEESFSLRLEKYVVADDVYVEKLDLAVWHSLEEPGPATCHEARIFLANRVGQPGWDLIVPQGNEPYVGATSQSDRSAAWEELRVRAGVPRWGHELTPETLAAEALLEEKAISYKKGCYIGQEVISRVKSVGRVNRRLVKWRLTQPLGFALPTSVFRASDSEGRAIGQITSLVGREGLGYLHRSIDSEQNEPLVIRAEGLEVSAEWLEVKQP
ncbi:MAG: YgfZ/GcvT domain-containing protein [Verrucomicrobiales bacterium]